MYSFLKSLLDPTVILLAVFVAGGLASRRQGNRRGSRTFLVACLGLYLTSISPVADALCYLLERDAYSGTRDDRGPLDVVVVLAGGVAGNASLGADTLNRQSAIRLVRAIEVFNASGAKYLVCSGTTEGFNEAGIMADAARRLGVPAASIMTDLKSRNTREHAVELSKLFGDKATRFGLVTSAYHLPRSTREFRKYFPNVVAYPTDYLYAYRRFTPFALIPSASHLNRFAMAGTELVGIAWYRVRGAF